MCMCAETSKWKLLRTVEGWIFSINLLLILKKNLCFHFVSRFLYLSTMNVSFQKGSEMTAPGDWGYIYPWRMQEATAMAGLLSHTHCLILMRWDHSWEWEAKLFFHSVCSPQPPSWECKGKLILTPQGFASQTGIHQEADMVRELLCRITESPLKREHGVSSNLIVMTPRWKAACPAASVSFRVFTINFYSIYVMSSRAWSPICFSSYAVTAFCRNGERGSGLVAFHTPSARVLLVPKPDCMWTVGYTNIQ